MIAFYRPTRLEVNLTSRCANAIQYQFRFISTGVEKRQKPYLGASQSMDYDKLFTDSLEHCLVAVALREQVLPQEVRVPIDDSDWAVDAIVCPAFGSSDGFTDIVFRRDTQ